MRLASARRISGTLGPTGQVDDLVIDPWVLRCTFQAGLQAEAAFFEVVPGL